MVYKSCYTNEPCLAFVYMGFLPLWGSARWIEDIKMLMTVFDITLWKDKSCVKNNYRYTWYVLKYSTNISEDLSWSCYATAQTKKSSHHLYYLRRLRYFKLSTAVLWNFYTFSTENNLPGNINVWFRNSTKQDRRALVTSAKCIIQTIYKKRCCSKAKERRSGAQKPNIHY